MWHGDQQGPAAVTLAGLLNALKLVGKELGEIRAAMIGAGVANVCTAQLLGAAGVPAGNLYVVDSQGLLHPGREELKEDCPEKWELCLRTNAEGRAGGILEAMKDADVVIALSQPGPDMIRKEWIKLMADDPIVFACANPIPEIWPWEAKEAGPG